MHRTWHDGVKDSIRIIKYRQQMAELYRDGELMRTHPAVFATLEEILVFLEAMLERGEYSSRTSVE